MPSIIQIQGFEELDRNTERLGKIIAEDALKAAEDAAAEVVKDSVKAAAPRDTGELAGAIKVFESRDRSQLSTLQGRIRKRLLVGPEKKKGFYGFFLEKGWLSVGARRRKRTGTATTHSQAGVEGGTSISPKPWFEPAVKAVEGRAKEAGVAAFEAKVNQTLSGMK